MGLSRVSLKGFAIIILFVVIVATGLYLFLQSVIEKGYNPEFYEPKDYQREEVIKK